MKSKNIFVFSQNFQPSSLADSIRTKSVVEYLISKEYNVNLFTQTKESKLLENQYLKVHLLKWANPTNINSFSKRLLNELILGFEIFFKILILKKNDYYFFTSPPFFSCLIGIFAKTIKGGDLILDIRDLYPDVFIHQKLIGLNSLIFRILKVIEKYLYSESKIVLAATEGLQKEISNRVKNKRVLLYRNGYSEHFQISNQKNDKFSVVFHGSLSRFQNIELLIEIVKEISLKNRNIHFFVIGSGPKEEMLKNLNLINFTFLGRLSNEDTAKIVNQCHLGLSLREDSQISIDAFPVKLYEYIGSGIPSITTPLSEGGKEIERLELGYNFNNTLSLIVDKILLLERDRILYNELIKKIYLNRETFNRKVITKEVFKSFIID